MHGHHRSGQQAMHRTRLCLVTVRRVRLRLVLCWPQRRGEAGTHGPGATAMASQLPRRGDTTRGIDMQGVECTSTCWKRAWRVYKWMRVGVHDSASRYRASHQCFSWTKYRYNSSKFRASKKFLGTAVRCRVYVLARVILICEISVRRRRDNHWRRGMPNPSFSTFRRRAASAKFGSSSALKGLGAPSVGRHGRGASGANAAGHGCLRLAPVPEGDNEGAPEPITSEDDVQVVSCLSPPSPRTVSGGGRKARAIDIRCVLVCRRARQAQVMPMSCHK